MSKTRNKKEGKKGSKRAARKGGPYDLRHGFRIGDRVLVADIPSDLKDPKYKDDPEMRTGELFRFCLKRKFLVRGFDRYGFTELRVDDDPVVKRKFGLNSIWLEPKFLALVSKSAHKVSGPRNGLGWKQDFLLAEAESARNKPKRKVKR
jgi:hypothetical protein